MQSIFNMDEIIKQVNTIDPASNQNKYSLDDIGNGILYYDLFGNFLRYNVTAKNWMYYDGAAWRMDAGNVKAKTAAEILAKALYLYAVNSGKEYRKHVSALGSINTRDRMITDASKHGAISSEQLDKEIRFLNLQNGTLDLESMDFLTHDGERLLSKVAGVDYVPGARSDVWERFLDEIMQGNEEKIYYLKCSFGYMLTGRANEDCLIIFFGSTTRNGKSTMLRTIGGVMGDYGVILPPDALAARQRNADAPSENIADLRGARFVHIEEPSRQMAFDAGLLKQLTGGTRIKTRRLRENNMEFDTTFTAFMSANYLPRVDDMTLFTSDRLRVVSFDRHFEPAEQDKDLRERLSAPDVKSAILNWMLDGLREYREHGLVAPDCITHATSDYMKASDKLASFVNDELVKDAAQVITAKDIYIRYSEWCRGGGYMAENKSHFLDTLRRRGFLSNTGTVNGKTLYNVVRGYRLRDYGEEIPVNVPDDDLSEIPF